MLSAVGRDGAVGRRAAPLRGRAAAPGRAARRDPARRDRLPRRVPRRARRLAGDGLARGDRAAPGRRRALLRGHEPDRDAAARARARGRRRARRGPDRPAHARDLRLEPGGRGRRRRDRRRGRVRRALAAAAAPARPSATSCSRARSRSASVAALYGLDRATGGSSHVTQAAGGGPATLVTDLGHRLHTSWAAATATWVSAFEVCACLGALVVIALLRPRRPSVDAFLVAIALSLLVNDTPTDVAAYGALGAGSLVAWEWTRRGQPKRSFRLAAVRRPAPLLLLLALLAVGLAGCSHGERDRRGDGRDGDRHPAAAEGAPEGDRRRGQAGLRELGLRRLPHLRTGRLERDPSGPISTSSRSTRSRRTRATRRSSSTSRSRTRARTSSRAIRTSCPRTTARSCRTSSWPT